MYRLDRRELGIRFRLMGTSTSTSNLSLNGLVQQLIHRGWSRLQRLSSWLVFPCCLYFLLDVKLSLLFISELIKVVSTGVGVLFTVLPDSLCNRVNQDVSLLVAGCETFSSVLLDQRLGVVQSSVKRFSAGGSLRFFSFLVFLSFAVFFFFGLIHL
jgi:hypothetical protein